MDKNEIIDNEPWWYAPIWGLRWAFMGVSCFQIINNAPSLVKPDTPIAWNYATAGFFLLFSLILSVVITEQNIIQAIGERRERQNDIYRRANENS